jgi:tetratricopeptide (TPR) repeat protein
MDEEKVAEYARLIGQITGVNDPRPVEEIAELTEAGRQGELTSFEIYRYAASLARAGQIDRAEQVAALIKDDEEVRTQAVVGIAEGMIKAGLLDRARTVLDSMLVNSASPEKTNIEARAHLAEAYGKVGKAAMALVILSEAEALIRSGAQPDYKKADELFALANVWARVAERKHAYKLWIEVFDLAQKSLENTLASGGNGFDEHQLLIAIIRKMTEFKMSDEATTISASIQNPQWREKAEKLIADLK